VCRVCGSGRGGALWVAMLPHPACVCGTSAHLLWALRPPQHPNPLLVEQWPGQFVCGHDESPIGPRGFQLDDQGGTLRVWDPTEECRNCIFWAGRVSGPQRANDPDHEVRPDLALVGLAPV
jgi:hypothetical protein